ncbi:Mov34/MPN/PAD-1 family protein [Kordiimonas sp.]|uniref:Mov34/MPN/PAD-1 family protein n=1 Tax=Kordiimonas sp. TaxID=1970157 RepID=UPI003A8E8DEA
MTNLTIAPGIVEELELTAAGRHPEEACALLLGNHGPSHIDIRAVAVSANVTSEDKCIAFEVDSAVYLRVQKAARAGGPAVVGVWHSHPNGRAEPSEIDCSRSVEGGWVWLITAVSAGKCSTRAFQADTIDPHQLKNVTICSDD